VLCGGREDVPTFIREICEKWGEVVLPILLGIKYKFCKKKTGGIG
jgi:hypothetical protein